MKFIGVKRLKIEALKLPGDWKKILKSDDAGTLAESLAHVPILQRPGVRKKDRAVIWGRHRLAALHIDGQRSAEVDLWDCSDEELALAKDVENAFRRGPDVMSRMRLIERWAKEIADARAEDAGEKPEAAERNKRDNVPVIAQRGKPKTAKGEARERVAALAGVTPETLRKQEQRAKAKEPAKPIEWGDMSGPGGKELADQHHWIAQLRSFEYYGLIDLVTEDFARLVVETRRAIDQVDKDLRRTLAGITEMEKTISPSVFADLDLQTVYSRIQQQASALRAIYPVALCPYCKGVSDLMRRCKGCNGLSTVGQEALDRAPEELRAGGDGAGVFVKPNEFRRLSELGAA